MPSVSIGFRFTLLAALVVAVQSIGNDGDRMIKLYSDSSDILSAYYVRNTFGVVGGVKSCGGPGRVLEWRYEGCNGGAVCHSPADGAKRRGEFTFVPSETIQGGLKVRYDIQSDGTERTYDIPIPNRPVVGGQAYTIVTYGSANEALKGKTNYFKYMVLRQADNFVEACGEAVFQIV